MATQDRFPPEVHATGTILLICDMQPRFRAAVSNFDHVVATAAKMCRAANILDIKVISSEQAPQVFGVTDPELDMRSLKPELNYGSFAKTQFSMWTPETRTRLLAIKDLENVVICGIETHICVLQTALDVLKEGNLKVYVLADGVSSCNKEEIPIALERIRQAGGFVTTSESFLFQAMRDASRQQFSEFAKLIKAEKTNTQGALQALV